MIMSMEILDDFSTDQVIVKGKRTKRLRPSSSASSSGGGVRNGGGGEFSYNSLVSISPASSSSGISTSTEEDEDMANCLILLARGGFSPSEKAIKPPENKSGSRKFTEMATMTEGKVGIYLYECKTCSRTFPSFQALGGHRASHKKPKTAADVDQKKSPPPAAAEPNDVEGKFNKFNTVNPSTSTQLPIVNVENKPKVHECSICGSEFASGQALGGHMRRHRSAINPRSGDGTSSLDVSEKSRNILELDLNLPAPPEDDHRETEFHQFSTNQQPRLVFSAAALVDCHY